MCTGEVIDHIPVDIIDYVSVGVAAHHIRVNSVYMLC